VASKDVSRVAVVLKNGRLVNVPLNAQRAFRYPVAAQETGTTLAPGGISAFDASGALIDTRELG
jgi:hypothetical protein